MTAGFSKTHYNEFGLRGVGELVDACGKVPVLKLLRSTRVLRSGDLFEAARESYMTCVAIAAIFQDNLAK